MRVASNALRDLADECECLLPTRMDEAHLHPAFFVDDSDDIVLPFMHCFEDFQPMANQQTSPDDAAANVGLFGSTVSGDGETAGSARSRGSMTTFDRVTHCDPTAGVPCGNTHTFAEFEESVHVGDGEYVDPSASSTVEVAALEQSQDGPGPDPSGDEHGLYVADISDEASSTVASVTDQHSFAAGILVGAGGMLLVGVAL